jgi:hypothetical protein
VEELAVADVVAVDELLVPEQVAVRVEDALGEAGRARRVVELGGVVGCRVHALELGRALLERRAIEHEHLAHRRAVKAPGVVGVGDEQLGLRVAQPVRDALVPVQHGHREEDRPELPDGEEHRRRLRRGRQHHRDPVAPLHPVPAQDVREAIRQLLQLAPAHLSLVAEVVRPHHRELLGRVLVAHVVRDVVAIGDVPAVVGYGLLVGHGRSLMLLAVS